MANEAKLGGRIVEGVENGNGKKKGTSSCTLSGHRIRMNEKKWTEEGEEQGGRERVS